MKDKAYLIELDLSEPLPPVLDLGAEFSIMVALTTASGRDLGGAAYRVLQGEEIVGEGSLPEIMRHDPTSDDHDPRNGPIDTRDRARITLVAPRSIGSFQWTLLFPAQEIGGIAHAEASLGFSFQTGEHRTSLAVWDAPSPVVAGGKFVVKVGAKCSASCSLKGQKVELRNDNGRVVAAATLATEPLPGAEDLYWTELEVTAPAAEGFFTWSVGFSAHQCGLPHQGASASLSFMTVAPAIHQVSVKIVERETALPIEEAQVRLGYYRAATDKTGVAHFKVASGKHRLFVWKATHNVPEQVVDVERDLALTVEAETLPKQDPYAFWQG